MKNKALNIQQTDSMEQSPSWEANSCSSSQEMPENPLPLS
jgi:hypothetical protein